MITPNKFLITNWCGVPHKFIRNADGTLAVHRFQEALDAGINLIAAYDYGYETNCEVLAACEKLGMKVTMEDGRIHKALHDAEHRRELLEAVVRDYSSYPALQGYHIVDEPNSGAFPALADIREILSELDPAHEAYYNLFPNYASLEMLGNPSYYDHVEQFVEMVKPEILSYDHYHFCKVEAPKEEVKIDNDRERQIYEAAYVNVNRPGFFDNIEDCMAVSQKTGVPFMIIILVVEHGCYRNLTEAELRWEVFNSLAYGIKRISYFTYWTPGVDYDEGDDLWHWKDGMIAKDGTQTHHYHEVARINKELQPIGNILLPYDIREVYHFGSEPDGKVRYWPGASGDITEMTADRATVGLYDGGYVLVANKNYTDPTTVTFRVTDGKRVRLYDKLAGVWKVSEAVDGLYTLSLAAGDGELVCID